MNLRPPIVWFLLTISAIGGCASSPEPGDFGYVALGASDAVGVGAVPLRRGYVFLIRDALKDDGRDVELMNLGIPDAEVDDIARVARLALLTRPRLITLWTGANDVIEGDDPEDFEQTLEDLLERLREQTDAVIVMGDLPDLTQLPRFRARPSPAVTSARVRAFNEAIERQAKAFDVRIARLSEVDMLDEITSDIDGFHPNNEGHAMIAERFLAEIRAAIRRR